MKAPYTLSNVGATFNSKTKAWSAPQINPMYNPKASLGQLVANCLSRAPQMVGTICHEDGFEMRNWEILRDSVRVALNLRDLGLQEGDVLGFSAGNTRHVAPVVFGAMLNGNPVGSVDPSFEKTDIKRTFKITRPKLVVCDNTNYHHVKQALSELDNSSSIYVFDAAKGSDWKSVTELLKYHPEEHSFVPPKLNCEKLPAFIISSSGTTGTPKAIPISHASLAYMVQYSIGYAPGHRAFGFSNLYWMSGVIVLLVSTFQNCVRIIIKEPFSGKKLLEIIKERQLNTLFCTPAQLQLLLLETFNHDDLKSMHAIHASGSIVHPSLISSFKVPVISAYGATEIGGIALAGKLSLGVQVKIVDDNGKRMGVGETGEICVKPVIPFLGYYNNPEETKKVYKDGFWHSGDIGHFDDNGMLHIRERKSEIFRHNYFFIDPTDVERELQEGLPDIGLIAVVGIPNPQYVSLPAALIVKHPGSDLVEEMVHNYAKAHLPHYQYLRGGVYFVNELPMTANGKVLRKKVKEMVTSLFESSCAKDSRYVY